jgi:hypothetical protein
MQEGTDQKPVKERCLTEKGIKDFVEAGLPVFTKEQLESKRNQMIAEFQLPKWILGDGRKCQECGKDLSTASVREIGLCLNAQNIGDIQVEIMCEHCMSAYYLFFRKVCENLHRFAILMEPSWLRPESIGEPVRHSELTPQENNLTDAIMADHKAGKFNGG